jgi:rhamnose utilization protein RhaD (predicted bifunctional aldolase and dehydrogenase)
MVNMQRSNLLDSERPQPVGRNPAACLPAAHFVDHTHATAFLALANLPDAEAAIREIFGDRLAVVPYIMPGFALAKKAAEVFDAHPDCEGLILLKHGHFTFGASAKESYDKVIEHTNMVEEWLAAKNQGRRFDCTVKRNRSLASEAAAVEVLAGAARRHRTPSRRTSPCRAPACGDGHSGRRGNQRISRS